MLSNELKGREESSFYLTSNRSLSEHHNYWHEVQVDMVWTIVNIEIILVRRDPQWEELCLPILKNHYLHELIPSVYIKES